MNIALKHAFLILTIALAFNTNAQYNTEVTLVSESDVEVTYERQENYIAYLNKRGISKKDIYKDYYTDKFVFDAGQVKSGEVIEIKVPFKNVSEDYIKITAVNEICLCLKAEFPEGEMGKFKPGETKEGTLKFSTKGMSGKTRVAVEIRTFANRQEINHLVFVEAEITK